MPLQIIITSLQYSTVKEHVSFGLYVEHQLWETCLCRLHLLHCVWLKLNCVYIFIKAEEGMEIDDRIAFACKYLPDSKVFTFFHGIWQGVDTNVCILLISELFHIVLPMFGCCFGILRLLWLQCFIFLFKLSQFLENVMSKLSNAGDLDGILLTGNFVVFNLRNICQLS